MQDDHSPENDSEKKPGPFQFSLRTLFLGVTLAAIVAASFANGLLLLLSPLLLWLIFIAVVAFCDTNFLFFLSGWWTNHRILGPIAFVVIWILLLGVIVTLSTL